LEDSESQRVLLCRDGERLSLVRVRRWHSAGLHTHTHTQTHTPSPPLPVTPASIAVALMPMLALRSTFRLGTTIRRQRLASL
jgi:hypothetical protein